MEKKFRSYTDTAFLKWFLELNNSLDNLEDYDASILCASLIKFFRQKTEVLMNREGYCPQDHAHDINLALVRYFYNRWTEGDDSIKLLKPLELLSELQSQADSLNYAFTDDQQVTCSASASTTTIFSTENYYSKAPGLFKALTIPIYERSKKHVENSGWSKLELPDLKGNAYIIADNYLLGRKENLTNNVKPLLDIILPENDLSIPIDITFFSFQFFPCYIAEKKAFRDPSESDIKLVFDSLNSLLNNDLCLNNVNLTLVAMKKKQYHERHIFSNHYVLKSGNSFTYFNHEGKPILPSDTSLDIHPLPADNSDEYFAITYTPFVRKLKSIMDNNPLVMGSKENRLFKFFLRHV